MFYYNHTGNLSHTYPRPDQGDQTETQLKRRPEIRSTAAKELTTDYRELGKDPGANETVASPNLLEPMLCLSLPLSTL